METCHCDYMTPGYVVHMQIGGLLSFNLIFPTDEPSIARLLGWAVSLSVLCMSTLCPNFYSVLF